MLTSKGSNEGITLMGRTTRRIMRAGGWSVAKRVMKPIPFVGTIVAVSLAGYAIRKKGLVRGVVHVGLDVTPVVGTAKGVLELFTGDLIPDRADRRQPAISPSYIPPRT
jgi:hypothetical protein